MNQMSNQTKQDLDNLARAQQMKINARLTALQAAQTLMATHGYTGIAGEKKNEAGVSEPAWIKQPGAVDHITLIAMAQDIESYILGEIEEETKKALDEAAKKLNSPRLIRP